MIMEKYSHIVQVHPVENGEPNLHKVVNEYEFDSIEDAKTSVEIWNDLAMTLGKTTEAVYVGRVNAETGELE
jgi:hypothetical protein